MCSTHGTKMRANTMAAGCKRNAREASNRTREPMPARSPKSPALPLALLTQHFFAQTQQRRFGFVVGPRVEIVDRALAAVEHEDEVHRHAVVQREFDRLGELLAVVFAVRNVEV